MATYSDEWLRQQWNRYGPAFKAWWHQHHGADDPPFIEIILGPPEDSQDGQQRSTNDGNAEDSEEDVWR
ncbi:hypothetical protein [Natronospira bacteriovora]|uniref:Uncharacterized protein n=1 Tax=Natronospira bacteriovora TaxID=3069753 RepID=A0ABU0W5B1_9GAMM|nr:hypothetical protein [Natronospira sp. AB-CW4]MDQ2069199.1 hypothetical protein [Natronospira sp. AB-CW4]